MSELVPSGIPPLHVAVLPDGARRWARQNSCSLEQSYKRSAARLVDVVDWLFEMPCDELTLLLSNWRNHMRSAVDCSAFAVGIHQFVNVEIPKAAERWQCKFRLICPESEVHALGLQVPVGVDRAIRTMNIVIAYDPVAEISGAVERAVGLGQSPASFPQLLTIRRPMELAIRSGGCPLFSGFFPLQLSYARLHCFDALFNDSVKADYQHVVESFLAANVVYGT